MKVRVKYYIRLDIYKIMFVIKTAIIRVMLHVDEDVPYLSIYLFNIKVYRRIFQLRRKTSAINVLQKVDTANRNTLVSYGFYDPSTTVLLYSAISAFSGVEQAPDFLPAYEYIIVDGSAHIFVWTTIMNFINRRKVEH